jgi:hypothetical protein
VEWGDFADHELVVRRQGRCRHGAVSMNPVHANACDIAALEAHALLLAAGVASAGHPCSSRARARVRSIGKTKRFLIVTIFVGPRIARQPSALRTVVRPDVRLSVGQLAKAGRPPYFASRRYSVDRAIPRRRAACVRFPSQARTWARIAWRSASRRSPAPGGGCSSSVRAGPGVTVRTSSGRSSASIRSDSASATVASTTLRSSRTLPSHR